MWAANTHTHARARAHTHTHAHTHTRTLREPLPDEARLHPAPPPRALPSRHVTCALHVPLLYTSPAHPSCMCRPPNRASRTPPKHKASPRAPTACAPDGEPMRGLTRLARGLPRGTQGPCAPAGPRRTEAVPSLTRMRQRNGPACPMHDKRTLLNTHLLPH